MALTKLAIGNWKKAEYCLSAYTSDNINGDGKAKSKIQLCDIRREIHGTQHWKGLVDPINPLLKAEILRYGDFAQQCYDSFEYSNLSSKYYGNSKRSKSSLSHRLELVKCGRGYQVIKYIYANTRVLDSFFGEETNNSGAWIGFIAVCIDADEIKKLGWRDIVVAWRGTGTPHEWMQNLRDILVPATTSQATTCSNIQTLSKPDARVEKGFLACYTSTDEDSVRCRFSAREIVVGELTRLLNEYKNEQQNLSITFTGHSLGAALATLSAYDVRQIMVNSENCMSSIPVTMFAFASPRVGNLSFAQHMEEIGVKVLRLVNNKDLVPKVPGVFVNEKLGWLSKILHWLPWAYVHVGVEITFDSTVSPMLKKTYNPAFFHNLEVYLHAVDGFQGNKKLPFKSSGRDAALVNKSSDLLIQSLGIPSYWWERRNKEMVKRVDGILVYSPTTPTPIPLPLLLSPQ